MAAADLILASASPRRRDLLDQLGVRYVVEPAAIDETPYADEAPSFYVQRMAQEKAQAVAQRLSGANCKVLAADTTVVVDDTVLGKPESYDEAMAMLTRLSGRWHSVLTAVCLVDGAAVDSMLVATQVEFVGLSQADCAAYLATAEPWDKAGAYGIQGLGGAFVHGIRGSYTNVVGLPLNETWQLLSNHGIASALTPTKTL